MSHDPRKDFYLHGAQINRRAALKLLGSSAAGVAAAAVITPELHADEQGLATNRRLSAADFGTAVCRAAPKTGTGPYYFNVKQMRQVIHENRPGIPLRVGLRVTDADCRPRKDLLVDLWHCDALGFYSGYDSDPNEPPPRSMSPLPVDNNDTFCRGIQATDENGIVVFDTIYPGWYHSRAPHIHIYVHQENNVLAESQFLFPTELNTQIYSTSAPYTSRSVVHTNNNNDFLTRIAGDSATFETKAVGDGYLGTMIIEVNA